MFKLIAQEFVNQYSFLNLFNFITFRVGASILTSLFFSLIFGQFIIENLSKIQPKGQPIREDGPETHIIQKAGTPTMGGVLIILSVIGHAGDFVNLSYYQKFDRAVQSYKEGRFNLAAKYFTDILVNEREYRDPAAQLLMAKCQYNLRMFDKAQRSCKSVLANYPNCPYEMDALILMGDILFEQGRPTNAFSFLVLSLTIPDPIWKRFLQGWEEGIYFFYCPDFLSKI